MNLTPIIWGVLISIKQPVDAFSVPPKLIFTPTFEFHQQVWVEKAFWHFLINSAIISAGTVILSVSVGTMAAYGLSRLANRTSRGLLFGLLAMRMFPHILLAIPFFVLAKSLGTTNPINMLKAAEAALRQLRRPEEVAKARGKQISEVLPYKAPPVEETLDAEA